MGLIPTVGIIRTGTCSRAPAPQLRTLPKASHPEPYLCSWSVDRGKKRGAHAPLRAVFGTLAEDFETIREAPPFGEAVGGCAGPRTSFRRGCRKQHARARALPVRSPIPRANCMDTAELAKELHPFVCSPASHCPEPRSALSQRRGDERQTVGDSSQAQNDDRFFGSLSRGADAARVCLISRVGIRRSCALW